LSWLNKLLGQKPADASRQANAPQQGLPLYDLDRWLGNRSLENQKEDDILRIYSQLAAAARELEDDVEKLSSASPAESTPPRLLKAGLAARDAFCQQMLLLREKLLPPSSGKIEQAIDYHHGIANHLSRTALKFGRAQRYAASVFPEEVKRINSDLNRLNPILIDLEKILEQMEKEQKRLQELKDALVRFEEDRHKIEILEKEIARDQAALAELRDSAGRVEVELEELLSCEDGQKREMLKEALDGHRLELKEIEAEAAGLISPLNKALARMIKQDSIDRVTLQNRRVLEQLSVSPLETLDPDIPSALQELQENIDLLGIRDKKKEKIVKHLNYLVDAKLLEALKTRHRMLQEKIAGMEDRLKESSLETDRLEDELKDIQAQMERREEKIRQSKDLLAALEERAAQAGEGLKARFFELAEVPLAID
jgi:DNA repair exonuclease SbcCD ATPase subunit